ncbi:MAG: hypothetical protein HZB84_05790 [Deltaproteobacteria bacterium]|nr:hypothetical protein [Deltaproteobacteria bacterium]
MRKIVPLLMIFFFFAPSLYPAALSAAEKREARACDISMKSCMHGDRCPMKEAAKRKTTLVGGQGRSGIKTGAKDAGCRQCFRCREPGDAYDTQVKKAPFIKGAAVFSSDGAPLPSVEFERGAYNGPALPAIERPPASAPIV